MKRGIPHIILKFLVAGGILILLLNVFVRGQQTALKFDKLTTENTMTVKGLSQNSAYCLIQDHEGFIWIGTWDGLNKYDGYNFIIYNTSAGLSDPTVNCLLEDDEKRIWIGTDNGLNTLDRGSGKIDQLFHAADNPNSLSNDFINNLYQDKKGFIWISTAYGLNRYDKMQGTFSLYNFFQRNSDSTFSNFVTRVLEDENGKIWIGTHHGIHCYDPEKQTFQDYLLEPDFTAVDFIKSNFVEDIAIDENSHVYAATLNGVFIIKPGTGIIHHMKVEKGNLQGLSGNQVNALLIDSKGTVWIGTSQGLDLFDPVLNTITNYKAGISITNISNEDIRSFMEDQTGTVWIGTYKGLNKVDRSPSKFTHYENDPEDPNSLSDNIVYCVLEDNNKLVWIGTYGGLNLFDRANNKFSVMRHNPDNPESISSNKIRTLALDSSGYIWVGTENEGMNRINPLTGKVTRFYHNDRDSTSLCENVILSTMVDSKGRIWIGTVNKGLSIMNPQDGKCVQLSKNPGSKVILSDNNIWCEYEDRNGNFWLGTNEGLNKISPGLESVVVYRHQPSDKHSISSNRVFSVLQVADGSFWIGTMGGGLGHLDPVSGQFKTYTEREGLPNNVVYASLDDGEGNLWISTNWGLSKFNRQNETFVNYDAKDGVQCNEFNVGAYFKNHEGELFFGGMQGINIFHPSEITINKIPPRMAFTGIRVLNDLLGSDIENGEVIRLKYNENFFSIEFSGLDYTNPSKNLYRYKLENYDDDWVLVNASQRRADYRKVDPGTYHFMVTGSNNDGIWSQNPISLNIIIRPPWWQTWIFRATAALVLLVTAWAIMRWRLRSIRKKHDVEKKMLSIEKQVFELEQKALRLQMNPHFIFNSLNAIQNFVLAKDTDKAVNYLAKFSHLMRMILANSTASLITLKDELKALTYYIDLEKLRFDDKFDYNIIRDPNIDEEFVEIPPMLFQPFVENAIIHGLVNSPERGMLEISIRRIKPGTMLCKVKDNGIGREKAIEIRNKSGLKRQPKGMIITQERLDLYNKQNNKNYSVRITDLKDDKGEAAGTMVEFTIHYNET